MIKRSYRLALMVLGAQLAFALLAGVFLAGAQIRQSNALLAGVGLWMGLTALTQLFVNLYLLLSRIERKRSQLTLVRWGGITSAVGLVLTIVGVAISYWLARSTVQIPAIDTTYLWFVVVVDMLVCLRLVSLVAGGKWDRIVHRPQAQQTRQAGRTAAPRQQHQTTNIVTAMREGFQEGTQRAFRDAGVGRNKPRPQDRPPKAG